MCCASVCATPTTRICFIAAANCGGVGWARAEPCAPWRPTVMTLDLRNRGAGVVLARGAPLPVVAAQRHFLVARVLLNFVLPPPPPWPPVLVRCGVGVGFFFFLKEILSGLWRVTQSSPLVLSSTVPVRAHSSA